MSNMHRIQWIDAQIRAARYPNARTIAEHFEISSRQAARDIEYLRYSMGAPLSYAQEHSGYFYKDETFTLPALMLTGYEQESLSYLAVQYKSMGSESAVRMANLFERLIVDQSKEKKNGNTQPLPVVKIDEEKAKTYSILQKAVYQKHKVQMRYMNNKNEVNERVFCPYKLFVRQGLEYIVGFCEMRQEIRVFRVDRIKKLKELTIAFQVQPGFEEENYGESSVFLMRTPYAARIRFNQEIPSKLMANAEKEEDHLYRISFYNSRDFLNDLLTQSSDFCIIAPEWLRRRFLNRLKKLWQSNFNE